jgi:UDP-N-acetylglucosamine:LPS N-acetylglucosamine transferase
MLAQLKELGVNRLRFTDLRPYIYDQPRVMAAADLVICRGGASPWENLQPQASLQF